MSRLSGEEKAAVLLKSLPSEAAEKVLSQFDSDRGGRLRRALHRVEQRPNLAEDTAQVLHEFNALLQEALAHAPYMDGATPPPSPEAPAHVTPAPPSPVRLYTENKNGDAKESTPEPGKEPLAILETIPPDKLALALQGEQPRTIALIFNSIKTDQAGAVLKRLPPEVRRDVSLRLSQIQVGSIEMVQRMAGTIVQKAQSINEKVTEGTGDARFRRIADMLRLLDKTDRMEILAAMEQNDAQSAAFVKDFLYLFDDLLMIEDRSLQKLLGEIDSKGLALALKGATEEISKKVMANLSKRARESLNEEMEFMGSVASSQIQEAQKMVVGVIQRLDVAGELVMIEK